MQNEAVITIPEQKDAGSITAADVEASMKRILSEIGISEDFLTKDFQGSTYSEFLARQNTDMLKQMRERWRNIYGNVAAQVIQTVIDSRWAEQEYVGDEQGMLHPRAEKPKPRDVIIVGDGSHYRYMLGSLRALGLLDTLGISGTPERVILDSLAPLDNIPKRGHNRFISTMDELPYYQTASTSAWPERKPKRKSEKQKKREQRKRTASSRRQNRK